MRKETKQYFFIALIIALAMPFMVMQEARALGTLTAVHGGAGDDHSSGIAIDTTGTFVYVTGSASGEIGTATTGTANQINGMNGGFFSEILADTGELRWTEVASAVGDDSITSVDIGTSNAAMYMSGYSYGTVTLRNGTLTADLKGTQTSGNESYDAFVAMTSVNDTQRVTMFGSTRDDKAYEVAVDVNNDFVYAVGDTSGDIGSSTSAGIVDYFIAKLAASDLTIQSGWPKSFGTTGDDRGRGIEVDISGNVYVTGKTSGSHGDTGSNSGAYDVFVAKYTSSGANSWVTQSGTTGNDEGLSVAVDSNGDIYIAGCTDGDYQSQANQGGKDAFVSQYNSSGVHQWTTLVGTLDEDCATGVVVDSNSVFIAGYTEGDHGSTSRAGGLDAFTSKFDPDDGDLQWTNLMGSTNHDKASGLALDSTNGVVYVTGSVTGTPTVTLASGGLSLSSDYFVWKIGSSENLTVSPATGSYDDSEAGTTTVGETISFTVTPSVATSFGALSLTGSDSSEFLFGTDTCSNIGTDTTGCGFSVKWTPVSTGTKTAFVSIPNNPSSATSPTFSTHLVELVGAASLGAPGEDLASVTTPVDGSELTSSSVTWVWAEGLEASSTWWFYVGTTPGGNDIYSAAATTSGGTPVDIALTTVPTTGTVYVRLWTKITSSSAWKFNDYSYTTSGSSSSTSTSGGTAAALTSGTSGTLSGASHTFTWDAGTNPSRYWLDVGNQGVGSFNLYAASEGTNLTRQVTGLPTDASTVYVRLWTQFTDSTWASNDYTFTAAD